MSFTTTHRVNKRPYEAGLFVDGEKKLIAIGISYAGWRGSRIQDLRWKLVELVRLGSYPSPDHARKLLLWQLGDEGCTEWIRFDEGVYSLFPVGGDLLLVTQDSLERWTPAGFERLTQSEQEEIESAYEVLGEAKESSDWSVKIIGLLGRGDQEITSGDVRVESTISYSGGFPFRHPAIEVKVFQEGDLICGIRDTLTEWEAVSPGEYADLFGLSS